MRREDLPAPEEGFVLTHFLTVADVAVSREFYRSVFGGEVLIEESPCILKVANAWIILNVGGGPTDDKPNVTLAPPADPNRVSSFLNVRVADIQARYEEWRSKGAEFPTPPLDRGAEIRCYMKDPAGYIIEVGQISPDFLRMLEG